jgi:hypothetical protein
MATTATATVSGAALASVRTGSARDDAGHGSDYVVVEDRRRSEDGVERKGNALKVLIICFLISCSTSLSQVVVLPRFFFKSLMMDQKIDFSGRSNTMTAC